VRAVLGGDREKFAELITRHRWLSAGHADRLPSFSRLLYDGSPPDAARLRPQPTLAVLATGSQSGRNGIPDDPPAPSRTAST
jgi:hypothetical protein